MLCVLALTVYLQVQLCYVVPLVRERSIESIRLQHELAVGEVAADLELRLRFAEESLQDLAASEGLRTLDGALIQSTLATVVSSSPVFGNLYAFERGGRLVASTMGSSTETAGSSYADAAFFRTAFGEGRTYFGDSRIYRESGIVTASVGVPVVDDAGQRVGVLVGSISLNDLSQHANTQPLGEGAALWLLDRRGRAVTGSRYQPLDQGAGPEQPDLAEHPLFTAALGQAVGQGEYDRDGVAMLGSYARVEPSDWVVIVEAPAAVTLARTNATTALLRTVNATAYSLCALLIGLGAWVVRRDRIAVQSALAQSEHERRATLDALPVMVHVIDRDYRLMLVNRELLRGLRDLGAPREPEEHVGDACPYLTPEDRAHYERVFASGAPQVAEQDRVVNGRRIVVQTRLVPVVQDGAVARVVTAMLDITALRESQEIMQRRYLAAESLTAISATLGKSLSREAVLQTIGQEAGRVGVPFGLLFSLDDSRGLCVLETGWGLGSACLGRLRSLPQSAIGAIAELRRGQAVMGAGLPPFLQHCNELVSAGLVGHLWAPLEVEGRLWGLVLVGERVAMPDDQEARLYYRMAGQSLAFALRNAQLYEELSANSARVLALAQREARVRQSERDKLARELHDEVAQLLTSLLARVDMLQQQADLPARVRPAIVAGEETVRALMDRVHRICEDLRPVGLETVGLAMALRTHLGDFGRTHGL
ncbi:MAG: PAS domain-containing protein, partial [Chloroflexi bacterium]|nr:PAS domain-containing protein [Chloroflexota bacterium]